MGRDRRPRTWTRQGQRESEREWLVRCSNYEAWVSLNCQNMLAPPPYEGGFWVVVECRSVGPPKRSQRPCPTVASACMLSRRASISFSLFPPRIPRSPGVSLRGVSLPEGRVASWRLLHLASTAQCRHPDTAQRTDVAHWSPRANARRKRRIAKANAALADEAAGTPPPERGGAAGLTLSAMEHCCRCVARTTAMLRRRVSQFSVCSGWLDGMWTICQEGVLGRHRAFTRIA